MKFQARVEDEGLSTLYEKMKASLPSVSPEVIEQQARQLGRAPLCKETFNDFLAEVGIKVFAADGMGQTLARVNAMLKSDLLKTYGELTANLRDEYIHMDAMTKSVAELDGENSPEYLKFSIQQAGFEKAMKIVEDTFRKIDEKAKAPKRKRGKRERHSKPV